MNKGEWAFCFYRQMEYNNRKGRSCLIDYFPTPHFAQRCPTMDVKTSRIKTYKHIGEDLFAQMSKLVFGSEYPFLVLLSSPEVSIDRQRRMVAGL